MKVVTWRVRVYEGSSIASSNGIVITADYAEHEYVGIERFELDPLQETVYSFAALVGCFFLVLVIPLMVYYSAIYREKMNEKIRLEITE